MNCSPRRHYKQNEYCCIDQDYKFSNLKRTIMHYALSLFINKLYNFNTLKKYVETIVIIDLSAIKIIYEIKTFHQETGNLNKFIELRF